MAAAQQGAPSAPVAREIEALVDQQTALLMRSDADGLAALFTQDAVYASASGEMYSGPASIRDFYARTFATLDYARQSAVIGDYNRESRVLQIQSIGDEAWALGRGRLLVNGPYGLVTRTDHWVAVYSKQGGQWKIRLLSVGEDVQPCDCDRTYQRRP
jgi:uncharacterized protein (TIGR02246 family)